MRRLALCPFLLLVGCRSSTQDYFPLAQGNVWNYVVSLDGDIAYQELRVVGRTAVGPHNGWLLESDMGDSRLAWDGDRLIAAEMAGVRYSPPIPIFAPDGERWSGVVRTAGTRHESTATVATSNEMLDVAGRSHQTVMCVVTLESSDGPVQLTTWFFEGMGILRQEQRSGPLLTRNRKIDFVSGP